MEAFGAFLDEEWESLSKLFHCEDSDFLMHFNGHGDDSSSLFAGGENVADVDRQPLRFPSGAFDANFYFCSQDSSNSSEADECSLFASPRVESQPTGNGVNLLNGVMADSFECMNFGAMEGRSDGLMMPMFPDAVMEEILQSKGGMNNNGCLGGARIHTAENGDSCKEIQLKRKHEATGIHTQDEGKGLQSSELNSFDQRPKKRARVYRDAQKNKNRKNKKAIEINTDGGNGQSSSTCSSEEDDSNASQELNAASISESKGSVSNGKAKANRGPATDPQSLYARRRRERINERLRILQNLVPNGTKVDISTMLEEAVHYVKFLQLQIKLLSSDDLWMYAPIAYNGMDIGLCQRIGPNPCSQN